jgi:putative two-component system response regulator
VSNPPEANRQADRDRKPTVLVVDDAPESIDVLRSVLGEDYRVLAAVNGQVALRVARDASPDIILLDVMMPEIDGYEVCRRLKQEPATSAIPVIFITTLSEAANEAKGLALGAVDYITKPYVPDLVRARVHTHLRLVDSSRLLEQKVRQRTAELLDTRLEIIRRLGRAAEYRDNETGTHVVRISHYARLVALAAGTSDAEADLVMHVAPMHDIGKIGIPDSILLKQGPLDALEWQQMKRHTTIGAQIIGDHVSELLRAAKVVALRHHERWDGTGYPDGLRGEEIPSSARVVAVVDVFDALVSERPYKRPWAVEEAVEEIRRGSGRQFDPGLVPAFLEVLPECLQIAQQYRDP